MVQITAEKKGKGKTKHLLDMTNVVIKGANGTAVCLDESARRMHGLNNKTRFTNVSEFPLTNSDGFLGFICGIISQNHDLETMCLDSFLGLSCLEGADISDIYMILKNISEKYRITSVLSVSVDATKSPECTKGDMTISL